MVNVKIEKDSYAHTERMCVCMLEKTRKLNRHTDG